MNLRLHTLGATRLDADGETLLGAGKPFALLVFLACSPFPCVAREQLVDMLWADVSPERARQTLRQTIWQLRRLLGADAIVNENDGIRLAIPIVIDRNEFIDAANRRDFPTAVGRYHGPFLPNFALPGAADFEYWADVERQRLHRAYVQASEGAIRSHLDQGRADQAVLASRVLRDADREREPSWRLLLQALIAAGDQLGFTLESADLSSMLEASGRTPEPATRSILNRAVPVEVGSGPTSSERMVGELVGREMAFADLVRAWDGARAGRGNHLRVIGGPGLGKTRLLRDFRRRAATGAGAVAYIRCPLADRDIAYSAAAAIARALAELPGAIGIAPETAAVIVGLDPTLSSRYPVRPDASAPGDVLRRRVLALDDVIGAVTSERPLLLLIDDLHWIDPESRQILDAINERVAGHDMLIVSAARHASSVGPVPDEGASVVALEPLTLVDVETLVASIARLPEGEDPRKWMVELHRAASGSPLLVLEMLQLAISQQWIEVRNNSWIVTDQARLVAELAAGSALERRLALLGADAVALLLDVVTAASPVAIDLVADPSGLLASLEQQGFVRRLGTDVQVAHDEIAATLAKGASAEVLRQSHARLASAMMQRAGDSRIACVRAARHALAAAEGRAPTELMTQLYQHRLQIAARERDVRSDRDLAADLLGVSRDNIAVARLLGTRSILRRFSRGASRGMGAAALLLLIVVGTAGKAWWSGQPSQLVVRVRPMAVKPITPAPLVEVQDRRGKLVESAADTIEAALVGCPSPLSGTRRVVADHGVAEFHGLWTFASSQGCSLRFTAHGLKTASVTLPSLEVQRPILRLVAAVVNGVSIDPTHPTVVARAGEDMHGFFEFRYTDYWGGAAVLLAAIPSWGPREQTFQTVVALGTPIQNGGTADSVSFRAPLSPGLYHVVFAFNSESDGRWIASGTNWTVGNPVWHDGNDVQDWTLAQLESARRDGSVQTPVLRLRGERSNDWVGATAIDVRVQ